jgi:transcriptional/translational regulatory protein YebC/TACO1
MIACTPPSHVPQETSEMAVIDSGARDFAVGEDGVWLVETDYSARESVCAALRAAGFAIRDTGHDYKAKSLVPPAVGAEAKINALMEALADHNDVQDVYSNLRR